MWAPVRPTNTRFVGPHKPRAGLQALERISDLVAHRDGPPRARLRRVGHAHRARFHDADDLGAKVDVLPLRAIASPGRSPAIAMVMITMASCSRSRLLRVRPGWPALAGIARRSCARARRSSGFVRYSSRRSGSSERFRRVRYAGSSSVGSAAAHPCASGIREEPSEGLRVGRPHLPRRGLIQHLRRCASA